MATSNNDNYLDNNENVSPMMSPNLTSLNESSHMLTHSPRRSVRLSCKSPQMVRKLSNETNIHRTISGGVANIHSPKMNIRNRTSFNNGRGGSNYASTLPPIVLDDGAHIRDENNDMITQNFSLPSDQSEDEEMAPTNNNKNNTTVPRKTSGLASRSEVLSYFDQQPEGYKCKNCTKVYQATKFSDTNLRKHLSSSIHGIQNMLFKSQIHDNLKINTIPISSERKKKLYSAAVNCIIEDGLPFDTFRRPGMSMFLSEILPGFVGPHRKTIRHRVAALYSLHTAKLRALIPKLDLLALTCDLWKSSRKIHFISLTAHTFTNKYEHVPIILGCRRIIGQHLSSNIERYIQYELNRIGITQDQIISITTDNGSNIKKATSTFKFGQPIRCMAHNLNLVVKKGLCLWIEPNPNDFPLDVNQDLNEWEDIGDDVDDTNNESDLDEDSIENAGDLISDEENHLADEEEETNVGATSDNESEDDVGVQLSSLTLNSKNSSVIDHFELVSDVFELMKKSRLLIKFVRNHSIINEYFNKCVLSNANEKQTGGLVLDMLIRWNSSFVLLDRLFTHKDILNDMGVFSNNLHGLTDQQKKQLKQLTFNQYEWELIEILRNVLEPFLDTTVALSGQTYPTMAVCFYAYRLLTHFLESSLNDDPRVIALKESLRYWFNIRFKSKLPQGQMEIMIVAAFLDPKIYNLMTDDDRKLAKKIIFKKLNNTSGRHMMLPSSSSSTTTTTTPVATTVKLNPLEKLAFVCGRTISPLTVKKPMTLDEEISCYIKAAKSANNFQEFWTLHHTHLPRLSNLVRRTNVIPATSVTSEALFSVASFLQRKQRSSLSSKTLRYLLVLKNRRILEKFEESY